ncbi:peptidase P60, partial [Proteus genomosp. 6]
LHHLYGRLSQRVPYGGYWRDRTVIILKHKIVMTN